MDVVSRRLVTNEGVGDVIKCRSLAGPQDGRFVICVYSSSEEINTYIHPYR